MRDITVADARRVLEVVDAGLIKGLGIAKPGQMCVEAAICFALGLPHGDNPQCVDLAVRAFKIRLNDARWPSNRARAKGLRALAVAQLGSKDVIDSRGFVRRLAEQIIRQIVPMALRASARRIPTHAAALEAAAVECEQQGTMNAAQKGHAAAAAAAAYAYAAAAAAAGYAYAAAAAAGYAYAAADAAAGYAYAAAADAAAYAAAAAADADAESRTDVLTRTASIALQILRDLNAPGIALLDAVAPE